MKALILFLSESLLATHAIGWYCYVAICILGNFHNFLSSADFFQNLLFENILSGIPSKCQTVWTLIKPDHSSGPDLGPNCLPRLSADDTGRQRVKVVIYCYLTKKGIRDSFLRLATESLGATMMRFLTSWLMLETRHGVVILWCSVVSLGRSSSELLPSLFLPTERQSKNQEVQRRMVLVVNFFEILKLFFFLLCYCYK